MNPAWTFNPDDTSEDVTHHRYSVQWQVRFCHQRDLISSQRFGHVLIPETIDVLPITWILQTLEEGWRMGECHVRSQRVNVTTVFST